MLIDRFHLNQYKQHLYKYCKFVNILFVWLYLNLNYQGEKNNKTKMSIFSIKYTQVVSYFSWYMYMKSIVFGKFALLLAWTLLEYHYLLILLHNNMPNRHLIHKVPNKINSWISTAPTTFVHDTTRTVSQHTTKVCWFLNWMITSK